MKYSIFFRALLFLQKSPSYFGLQFLSVKPIWNADSKSSLTLRSFVSLTLSFFVFLHCAKEDETKDYQRTYTLKVIYDLATKPKPNATQACVDSFTAAQNCIAVTTPTITETTLLFSLNPTTRYTTYQTSCVNNSYIFPLSPDFQQSISESARECFFRCDASYFNTRRNQNLCNSSIQTILTGLGTDTGTSNCRRNCVSVSNNNP